MHTVCLLFVNLHKCLGIKCPVKMIMQVTFILLLLILELIIIIINLSVLHVCVCVLVCTLHHMSNMYGGQKISFRGWFAIEEVKSTRIVSCYVPSQK